MRITYDAEVNAAYIMVVDRINDGEASTQIHSIMAPGGAGEITLDFDVNGRLLGIEILNANEVLTPLTLAAAMRTAGEGNT